MWPKPVLQQISESVTWDVMSFKDNLTWYLYGVYWESDHDLTCGAWEIKVWRPRLSQIVLLFRWALSPWSHYYSLSRASVRKQTITWSPRWTVNLCFRGECPKNVLNSIMHQSIATFTMWWLTLAAWRSLRATSDVTVPRNGPWSLESHKTDV